MKISHVRHKDIDIEKYDYCIENSPFGKVYAMSWYLDVVSPGWEILMAEDYNYVMPLPLKKKYGFRYAIQPLWTQQLGLFSTQTITTEIFDYFIQNIPFRYSIFYCNSGNNFIHHNLSNRTNLILYLDVDYQTLSKNYSGNCLRNIKKSQNFEWDLNTQMTIDEYEVFFLNNANSIMRQQYNCLKSIIKESLQRKRCHIWSVKDNHQNIDAAVFIIEHQNRFYYLAPVSSNSGKEKRAMFYLIDQFIRKHAYSPQILDFEGSMIPNIARFYEGFGAKTELYFCLKINKLPKIISLFKQI